MALLYFYRKYIKVACIVNYNKRIDSMNDVNIVQEQCKKYKIPLEIHTVDKSIYENNKENFQSLARKIRYDFFVQTAKKYDVDTIITAHHIDDFLETAYMQKVKKSKALFYGIQKHSSYQNINIYRPFLFEFRKNTLQRMCDEYKIPYAIDSSNSSDIYERNRVRKIIQSWDLDTTYNFKKEIFKYNKQNKKLLKQNNQIFKKFKTNNFAIELYHKLDKVHKYYLIYNYLSYLNKVNKNSDKINAIIDFLDSNSEKTFRIDEHSYICIRKHKLVYKEN